MIIDEIIAAIDVSYMVNEESMQYRIYTHETLNTIKIVSNKHLLSPFDQQFITIHHICKLIN